MKKASALTTSLLAIAISFTPAAAQDRTALFQKTSGALVIIKAGNGSASGSVVQMGDKKYLVTNEHVLRGGNPISATLLDGRKLSFKTLEIGGDADLARMEINEQDVTALSPCPNMPNIGDTVAVFGNSDGSGVTTSIFGRILGIGPGLIEIDAGFVRGNSGSPILDRNGEVLGVATFATRNDEPGDWVRNGTRYTQVRRFGMRLNKVQWDMISYKDYFTRVDALADIETFCSDFYRLRFTDTYINRQTSRFEYSYKNEHKRYKRFTVLCRMLSDTVETMNKAVERLGSLYSNANMAQNSRTIQDRTDAERRLNMDSMIVKNRLKEHQAAYNKVCVEADKFIRHNDWKISRLKSDADYWLAALEFMTREN